MSKLKISRKNDQMIIKSKLERSESVDFREWDTLLEACGHTRRLAYPLERTEKALLFSAQIGESLQTYLRRPISKFDFVAVLFQITEATQIVGQYGLGIHNLVLDVPYIWINGVTKELFFLYLPVRGRKTAASVFPQLYELIYAVSFLERQDEEERRKLLDFLHRLQVYSAQELKGYLARTYPDILDRLQRGRTEPIPGGANGASGGLPGGTGGYSGWEKNTRSREDWADRETSVLLEEEPVVPQPKENLVLQETGLLLEDEKEDDPEYPGEFDEGTVPLMDEEMKTTLYQEEKKAYPYLIQMNTYVRIELDKPVFSIGRTKGYVDYAVIGNPTVSQSHATFLIKGERFFVRDNGSTNHTFVNGLDIGRNKEYEILDGDVVTLSNEAFEFHEA